MVRAVAGKAKYRRKRKAGGRWRQEEGQGRVRRKGMAGKGSGETEAGGRECRGRR